jgi:pantoate--beta-alanine ligase
LENQRVAYVRFEAVPSTATIDGNASAMTPLLIESVAELRSAAQALREAGKRIGFVPTMGALHEGHLSLMRLAAQAADVILVSIFVNPTQFGAGEDLDRYPRNLRADLEKCRLQGVHAVFAPSREEMYPSGDATRVSVAGITEQLCGASRPTHFDGVATVVTKLFAAVGPCAAVFGKKDFQQLKLVERLTRDLLLPVTIVAAPIVRATDGLALSSRNAFLSGRDRNEALSLVRALSTTLRRYHAGERSVGRLLGEARAVLSSRLLKLDYLSLADTSTLEPFPEDHVLTAPALLAVAAFVGETRLIDNIVVGEDPDPLLCPAVEQGVKLEQS